MIAPLVMVALAGFPVVYELLRHRMTREFERYEGGRDTTWVATAARRLEDWYPHAGSFTWPGADSVLATVHRPPGVELVLQCSGGWIVAATRADLRNAGVSGGGPAGRRLAQGNVVPPGAAEPGARALVLALRDSSSGRTRYLMFDAAPMRPLHSPAGRNEGAVYSLAMFDGEVVSDAGRPGAAREALHARRRELVRALCTGALVTFALIAFGSSLLLRPLLELTLAARRLAAGDRSARVAVRGSGELAELGGAFNGMAESLERTEALRRQMVADVAHELRTPLTNLRCRLEAMQDGLAAAGPAELDSLHRETMLLARLVEDLQLLALADAGRLPLAIRPADVREVAVGAIAATTPRAQAAGVSLVLESPTEVWSACDPERVGQMLRNLLDNALAHSSRGGTVRTSVGATDAGVTVGVCDTGAGIAPEHLPHVFERFWRADPSRTRERGGSGLGLAIVRQLAEAQGGSVSVTSAPGEGACFRVRLLGAARVPSS